MEAWVLTKAGGTCPWCDKAQALLDLHGVRHSVTEHPTLDDARAALRDRLGGRHDSRTTFPIVVDLKTEKIIGGYEHLRDALEEPLLRPNPHRFTPFPVEDHDMWLMYQKALASFWTADEVSLAKDLEDWRGKLSEDERHFVKHVLAFFANSDGIVTENLALNFLGEVQSPEARQFLSCQVLIEAVHGHMYGVLVDTLIDDPEERLRMFRAIETVPCVRRKAQWALKWMDRSRRFAERLVAFACVEGILFSGSFCAIYWLKHRGLMPGLGLSNEFISRDEALHQQFGCLMYRRLEHRLPKDVVEAIVREAVDVEKSFITEAVPCALIGMNAALMSQYIEFVADRLLLELGYEKAYGSVNPFGWMNLISLSGKTNFFEGTVSEYRRAGVLDDPANMAFATDESF